VFSHASVGHLNINAVDKSAVSHWASGIAGSEKGLVEFSDADHSG
jgi:hypothetical protein